MTSLKRLRLGHEEMSKKVGAGQSRDEKTNRAHLAPQMSNRRFKMSSLTKRKPDIQRELAAEAENRDRRIIASKQQSESLGAKGAFDLSD